MPERPRSERVTQNRLAAFITKAEAAGGLGYRALGDWSARPGNRCVEPDLLRANLTARGYSKAEIDAALTRLMQAIDVTGTTLYQANLKPTRCCATGCPFRPPSARRSRRCT